MNYNKVDHNTRNHTVPMNGAAIKENLFPTENVQSNVTYKAAVKKTKEPIKVIVVNCVKLNVRKEPSRDSEILTTVLSGSELQVKNFDTDGWASVYTETGLKGYVLSSYIKEVL